MDHAHAPHFAPADAAGSSATAQAGAPAWRARAVADLLADKGILTLAELRAAVDALVSKTPADGARLVARAWVDPDYRARLLADPKAAAAELGIDTTSYAELVALENSDRVHHVVVCTLCSCYPRTLLGRPPDWYKSLAYRARVVVEPRAVLREFGLELPDTIEVRVVDSTADMRYVIIPRRPPGTDALDEAALARLVTRDSMIGVAEALRPSARGPRGPEAVAPS